MGAAPLVTPRPWDRRGGTSARARGPRGAAPRSLFGPRGGSSPRARPWRPGRGTGPDRGESRGSTPPRRPSRRALPRLGPLPEVRNPVEEPGPHAPAASGDRVSDRGKALEFERAGEDSPDPSGSGARHVRGAVLSGEEV